MKKYSTRKMAVTKIYDLTNCNESIDNKPIRGIVNQNLVNKVFRAKKRFKHKYDSTAKRIYIFEGKKLSSSVYKKMTKEELNLLKLKPEIIK